MLFLKLVIAAVLAVSVSSTPTEKNQMTNDAVLQRRAAAVKVFGKRGSRGSPCGACDPTECESDSSGCKDAGCCHHHRN
ncbi:uncharacterized protein MELLADRAFT_124388 [Melampsora larici-populina 98AG31]|uniref:Secreted protein n=1 Tax=Melampsora larici-populina (strain 98AG31 / pathotype 3-4-7) TaxID=747676 RepID=F4RL18_MELLP|nr:uncharacterized protein MELLADRAFT_124388 [Melampsora larici-populina 98AG31]EGG06942.1 secreted protein [Melampsora larici-populina 98AG31]